MKLNIRAIVIIHKNALIMVIYRNGKRNLCLLLADNVVIESLFDLVGLREILKAQAVALIVMHGSLLILGDYAHAEISALIADICAVAGNEPADLRLCFSAE